MSDDAGQPALWQRDDVRSAPGPVERATRQAIAAAQLGARLDGTAAALCALGWAIDAARAAGKFYGVAQAGPAYLDTARALGLVVEDQPAGGGVEGIERFLRDLSTPS